MFRRIITFVVLTVALMNTIVFSMDDDELIFDTAYSGFSTDGNWQSSSIIGYNGEFILTADAEKDISAQWDIIVGGGVYHIYIWHCLKDTGCDNAQVDISTINGTYAVEYSMAYGITGWYDLGVYDLIDGNTNIKVTGETGTLMVSAVKLVLEKSGINNVVDINGECSNSIILKYGSKIASVNGIEYTVEAPVLKDTVYIPIRFCFEQLGYDIQWISAEKKAVIINENNKIVVTVGNNRINVNSEEKVLDYAPQIVNESMMIGIDFFRMLGLEVDINNDDIIIIPDKNQDVF